MKDDRFQTRSVLAVAGAHLVHDVFGSFLAPLMPLLIAKLGFSLFLAGILDIVRKVPALFNPLVGRLADTSDMRLFVIAGPLVTAIAMSLLGVAPHYVWILVLVFTAGIGSSLFHVPGPVLIARHSGKHIGRGMSFFMVGGELARTLGPLLVLGAVALWGLSGTVYLIPLGLAASFVLWLRFPAQPVAEKTAGGARREPLSRKVVVLLAALSGIMLLRAGLKATLTIYLPTFLTAEGRSVWIAGAALAVLQFSGTAGVLVAGILSDRIGRRRALLIMNVGTPLLMLAFLVLPGMWRVVPLVLIGPFLFGTGPVMLSAVNRLGRDDMAYINGLYMTLNFVLNSVMILLAGLFADLLGAVLTWWVFLFVSMAAIPVTLLVREEHHG